MPSLEWDTGTLHCKLFSIFKYFKYSNMQYAFTEKHFRSYIVLLLSHDIHCCNSQHIIFNSVSAVQLSSWR